MMSFDTQNDIYVARFWDNIGFFQYFTGAQETEQYEN